MDSALRLIKTLMILLVGLFALVAGAANLVQMDNDIALVTQVVGAEGTFGVADWQKINSPWLVTLCWSVIPACKFATALFCLYGAVQMWRARRGGSAQFQDAKRAAMLGCGIMLAMLFGVFILVSETWFQQWQTELGAAILSGAERYIIGVGMLAIYVNMPDPEATSMP